tara:strand:- start:155 stop:322 length:168 start_codon:yes stop_codon:yes gene_type:complete
MSREWFVECYLEDRVNDLIENEGMSEADAIAYVEEELIHKEEVAIMTSVRNGDYY